VRVECNERVDALVCAIVGCDFIVEVQLGLVVYFLEDSNAGIIAGGFDGESEKSPALGDYLVGTACTPDEKTCWSHVDILGLWRQWEKCKTAVHLICAEFASFNFFCLLEVEY
jgi:hypothetical protein